MAEATMNPGGMPPQLPPAAPNGAGDGAAAALPIATSGMPAPGTQLPEALRGVSGGVSVFREWIDGVLKQPSVRRALVPLTILLVLVIAAVSFQFTQTTPYRPIMPGMTENDKQAAIEALKAGDFKPKVDTSSGQITVPESRYHEARIFLAGQGIPKEAQPIGMESLKDKSSMTTSQFMEQVQYNTAIEQELARSIMQISTIKAARVHLALPKQSVFVRERATPKASVVVTPHSGRGVSTPQVKAIVHLVSSSVPYLTPQNVSVVDDQGNLMTEENQVDAAMGLTMAQMAHKQRTEETYRNRVTELLAPVVGEAAVQAQVNLTLDYTQVETTTEDFDDKDKGVKPRSEALTTERKFKLDPEGIPGAMSNSPPPDADLTKNTNTDEQKPATNEIVTTKSTRNFEMDRSVRHVKNSLGNISRVTVAVVVAERPAPPPADGKPLPPGAPTTIPYTAQELDRMLNLVRSAVGYSEARGDVVTVAPARFETLAPEPPKPWYENGDIQNFIKIGLAALVIIVFMLAVVRPLVKGPTINQIMPPVPTPTVEEIRALEQAKAAEEAKIAAEEKAAAEELAAEEARIAEEEAALVAEEEAAALAAEEEAAALAAAEGEGEVELAEGEIEMQEGETLEELKARMQAMKPKKPTFTADMLDTANSYDDKVALIRMLVSQESGRVALVLKNMVKS
ncbi:MAG: Flagellar M-ring protein [Pseudomonadota bacterium]|jgi:flagellar M-ring protein FliF